MSVVPGPHWGKPVATLGCRTVSWTWRSRYRCAQPSALSPTHAMYGRVVPQVRLGRWDRERAGVCLVFGNQQVEQRDFHLGRGIYRWVCIMDSESDGITANKTRKIIDATHSHARAPPPVCLISQVAPRKKKPVIAVRRHPGAMLPRYLRYVTEKTLWRIARIEVNHHQMRL
ncbi:hypothetical protein LZ30DRAFT_476792 [Colletotrichum cereale]|nr:hypothetical protein LZ30DRAFT_476792 [Colletotrichum cereale]